MLKFSFFFSSTLTVCRSPSEPRRSSDSYRFFQSFTLSRTHTFDFPRPFMDYSVLWGIIGPGISGAVFGAGWWFWVDAVVCSFVKVPFVHYLPGTIFLFGFYIFVFHHLFFFPFPLSRFSSKSYENRGRYHLRFGVWVF